MIDLKPIEISDKSWMQKLIREENSRSADFNFTNIFAWKDTYCQSVGEYAGRLIMKLCHCTPPIYSYPVGGGSLKDAVDAMLSDCAASGERLTLRGITREQIPQLEELYRGSFELTADTSAWDYVYLSEKLSELSGKKLHAKRNHINRFTAEYPGWSFEPVTMDNLHECMEMNAEWVLQNVEEHHGEYNAEVRALHNVFTNYETLGLEGALLRVDGRVVAYTMGEKLNSDTFNVHYEKAFSDINGAYTMINREFARYVREKHPEIVYMNREDDMGRENLRKAKQSYFPDMMVEKYTAEWI